MDIGTAGTTEFKVTPDISFYMTDHPELLEEGVYQGLIHSHNNMSTFFSGTDTNTLQSEGMDMAHFVSLIVNNAGKYTAGITRKGTCTQEVKEIVSYQSWGGEEKRAEETFEVEEEILEWFNLDVIIEKPDTFETELLSRLEEIKAEKKKEKKYTPKTSYYSFQSKNSYTPKSNTKPKYHIGYDPFDDGYGSDNGYNAYGDYGRNYATNEEVKDNLLPFEEPIEIEGDIPYDKVNISEETLDSLVRQIITSSVIIPNKSAINITKWSKGMEVLYNNRFGDEKNFQYFAQSYIDYLLIYTIDEEALIALGGDNDALVSLTAYDVRKELMKLPKNKWLNLYIKYLDDYII